MRPERFVEYDSAAVAQDAEELLDGIFRIGNVVKRVEADDAVERLSLQGHARTKAVTTAPGEPLRLLLAVELPLGDGHGHRGKREKDRHRSETHRGSNRKPSFPS